MTISFLFSFLFFFFFSKPETSLSSLFSLGYPLLFLLCLFPVIFFLVQSCSFDNGGSLDSYFYYLLVSSFFFLLLVSFSSSDSFLFLLFLEGCVLLNLVFLLNKSKDQDKISSVMFMILFNILGSLPFFWFCSRFSAASLHYFFDSFFLLSCFVVLLCSKLPVFMLHFWLTKAHVSASGVGSMILASLMLKIGTVGLMKWGCSFSVLFFSMGVYPFHLYFLTTIFFLVVMIRFFDLKYMVACSSVVHMSVLFPLLLLSSSDSFLSSGVAMVSHTLVSCLIFFLATVLYEISYERSVSVSKSLESLSSIFSMTMFLWFLMNMGFPPFLSFMSELVFLYTFYFFDVFSWVLFFLVLSLSGLVFFSVISIIIYFKKFQYKKESVICSVVSKSILSFFFFFTLTFFS